METVVVRFRWRLWSGGPDGDCGLEGQMETVVFMARWRLVVRFRWRLWSLGPDGLWLLGSDGDCGL